MFNYDSALNYYSRFTRRKKSSAYSLNRSTITMRSRNTLTYLSDSHSIINGLEVDTGRVAVTYTPGQQYVNRSSAFRIEVFEPAEETQEPALHFEQSEASYQPSPVQDVPQPVSFFMGSSNCLSKMEIDEISSILSGDPMSLNDSTPPERKNQSHTTKEQPSQDQAITLHKEEMSGEQSQQNVGRMKYNFRKVMNLRALSGQLPQPIVAKEDVVISEEKGQNPVLSKQLQQEDLSLQDKLERAYQINFESEGHRKEKSITTKEHAPEDESLLKNSKSGESQSPEDPQPQQKVFPQKSPSESPQMFAGASPEISVVTPNRPSKMSSTHPSPQKHVMFKHPLSGEQPRSDKGDHFEAEISPILHKKHEAPLPKPNDHTFDQEKSCVPFRNISGRLVRLLEDMEEVSSVKRQCYIPVVRKLMDSVETLKEEFESRRSRHVQTLRSLEVQLCLRREDIWFQDQLSAIKDTHSEEALEILLSKIIISTIVKKLALSVGKDFDLCFS